MKSIKYGLSLALALSLALLTEYSVAQSCSRHAAKAKDIVDTAVDAGNFKTLAAALKAADLVDTLKGAGPFTVFAPTDEAFAKLPKGTVEESSAKTVQGSEVQIKVSDGKVTVDNANVTATDIKCGNGVIHVIDAVIIPK